LDCDKAIEHGDIFVLVVPANERLKNLSHL
jgi:hypothetical protein